MYLDTHILYTYAYKLSSRSRLLAFLSLTHISTFPNLWWSIASNGVVTVSRINTIIGLFRRMLSLL